MARKAVIYVIDDDDGVRDSIRILLECEGFAVVDFASCADLLRHGYPHECDCILLDVDAPGTSGLELLDQLRRDKIIIPVIVMTGARDAPIWLAAERGGAALLEKPFRQGELLGSIERGLQGQLR